jgi:D-alanyl-D-alanine-carboxypeptidase/D-alanyl-D-alanine-endopeptidase
MNRTIPVRRGAAALISVATALCVSGPVRAEESLLQATVEFSGTIAWLSAGAPAFVIAAVRDGETAFAGFGERAEGTGQAPEADTIMRIGSISKTFCGETLASMVAGDELALTDRLQDRLEWEVTIPEMDGRPIRLIDLVTHAAGLPREVPRPEAPADDPFATNTVEAQIAGLAVDPLLFTPGTGASYSNWGFDLLGAALANTSGKPYADLLAERVLTPLGMKDTLFTPRPEDEGRLMQGHFFDGKPMPFAPTPVTIECAGGLYTTASDMMRWMQWHLDRPAAADEEMRLIDHAAWLYRDGLVPAAGFDEGGGEMDALGLGWVVMMPEGNRPLILQKTGGLQGMVAYVAIAPSRGMGVFVAINQFSTGGFSVMVNAALNLITDLSPR